MLSDCSRWSFGFLWSNFFKYIVYDLIIDSIQLFNLIISTSIFAESEFLNLVHI